MSLGVISHAVELDRRCEGKTGMDFVKAKLEALNYSYCWGNSEKWPMVNRMLWRFDALYNGGDWFACSDDFKFQYRPHERLWTMRRYFRFNSGGYRKAHMSIDMLKDETRKLHNRRHGGQL